MDIVYIVRKGEINEDLRYSLRSIEKFAPKYNNLWIVGHKPFWVSDEIKHLPINQSYKATHWTKARNNLFAACQHPDISNDFILMNDDFILTRNIDSWEQSLNKVYSTFDEQIIKFKEEKLFSCYTRAFSESLDILRQIINRDKFYNYELHIPMILNKQKILRMLENKIITDFIVDERVFLYRSFYGNLYNSPFNEIIQDVKIKKGDPESITTDWVSVFDGWIGNFTDYPKFNKFIADLFPIKSKLENTII